MPSTLSERLRALTGELLRFAVVGGFCFILDTALAYVFRFEVGLGPNTSKALSTIIAVGVSYVGNRMWSFAHRVDETEAQHKAITVYAAINAVGLAVTLVPVSISHYVMHQESKTAFLLSTVIGTAMATVFRFWAYRKYVFAGRTDLAERVALV
jgi:putative flippase GtrA